MDTADSPTSVSPSLVAAVLPATDESQANSKLVSDDSAAVVKTKDDLLSADLLFKESASETGASETGADETGAGKMVSEESAGDLDINSKLDELQKNVTSLQARVIQLEKPAAFGGKKKQRRGGKSQRKWKKTKGGRQSKKRR